ncbi:MAG TPA: hypothetical protein VHO47_04645 [Candidatus Babeliales bacterium]|nr:hypothetical protein [Candidatus Babeliales bacterium]
MKNKIRIFFALALIGSFNCMANERNNYLKDLDSFFTDLTNKYSAFLGTGFSNQATQEAQLDAKANSIAAYQYILPTKVSNLKSGTQVSMQIYLDPKQEKLKSKILGEIDYHFISLKDPNLQIRRKATRTTGGDVIAIYENPKYDPKKTLMGGEDKTVEIILIKK